MVLWSKRQVAMQQCRDESTRSLLSNGQETKDRTKDRIKLPAAELRNQYGKYERYLNIGELTMLRSINPRPRT